MSTFRIVGLVVIVCLGLVAVAAYALLASYIYLAPSLPTVDAMLRHDARRLLRERAAQIVPAG